MSAKSVIADALKIIAGVIAFVVVAGLALVLIFSPVILGLTWMGGRLSFEGVVVIYLILITYLSVF